MQTVCALCTPAAPHLVLKEKVGIRHALHRQALALVPSALFKKVLNLPDWLKRWSEEMRLSCDYPTDNPAWARGCSLGGSSTQAAVAAATAGRQQHAWQTCGAGGKPDHVSNLAAALEPTSCVSMRFHAFFPDFRLPMMDFCCPKRRVGTLSK